MADVIQYPHTLEGLPEETKYSTSEIELRQITPEDDALWNRYGVYRANNYIDRYQYLKEDARNEYGEEFDEDEDRSIHVVALGSKEDGQPLIGSVRFIKRTEQRPLPIEQFFNIELNDNQGMEVSRLIVDQSLQGLTRNLVRLSLLRSATHIGNKMSVENMYATVEPFLIRTLGTIGIPAVMLEGAERTYIEEYNTMNMGVVMKPSRVVQDVEKLDQETKRLPPLAPFFAKGEGTFGLGRVILGELVGELDE